MQLTRYLRSELALEGLVAADVEEAIEKISEHIGDRLEGIRAEDIDRALREREESHTTSMGRGVAIPHATIAGIEDPVLAVVRATDPIQFGPAEVEPAWLFFVLLSPPDREREHIKILARICRLVRHPGFTKELEQAPDEDQVLTIIRRVDEEHV